MIGELKHAKHTACRRHGDGPRPRWLMRIKKAEEKPERK